MTVVHFSGPISGKTFLELKEVRIIKCLKTVGLFATGAGLKHGKSALDESFIKAVLEVALSQTEGIQINLP